MEYTAEDHGSGLSRRTLIAGVGAVVGFSLIGGQAFGIGTIAPAHADSGWGGYLNGRIPTSALRQVAGVYLRPDAATAMTNLRAAYQAAMGSSLNITEGYRALGAASDPVGADTQWGLWKLYLAGGPLAASPGFSNHGWGLAVDFAYPLNTQGTAGFNWMLSHSYNYGWTWAGQNFSEIEPWHWEYDTSFTPGAGEKMPTISSKQYASALTIRPQFQNFPYQSTPRLDDIAGGAGGAGFYDILGSFYISNFHTGEQVEAVAVLRNAATGIESTGYLHTLEGTPSGLLKASLPWRLNVPGGSNVYMRLRAVSGVPILDTWGVQILNFS